MRRAHAPGGASSAFALANDVADLVLEFGGSLSGEHGDGLVRGPFMEKMFGTTLYQAFRTVKRAFDPDGLFNPGKIVDTPPLTANLRYGAAYQTADPPTYFDYSELGGMGRGENLAILEINGIGSEAVDAFDPTLSLRQAYGRAFAQQRILFAIGACNRARGFEPTELGEFLARLVQQADLIYRYPASS